VDALTKVILSTLPDADEDTRKAAVARGKLRYSRFLKSVGANMVGDAQAALSELVNRCPGRMTTTIRRFGSVRRNLRSLVNGGSLHQCALLSGQS
jgi:hypothetical protein